MTKEMIVCPNCQKIVLENPTPATVCQGCGKGMPKLKKPKVVGVQVQG